MDKEIILELVSEFNQNETNLHSAILSNIDYTNYIVSLATRNCAIVLELVYVGVLSEKDWDVYLISSKKPAMYISTEIL